MTNRTSESPLRILHVTAPAPVGGLERVLQALASGHARRGLAVSVAAVLAPGDEPPALLESLEQADVHVVSVPVTSRRYWRERAHIADLCRRLAPDIVHTHGYRPDVLDAPVARALGHPTVTTVHGFTFGDLKNRAYQWVQRLTLRKFDAVVAVSRALRDEVVQLGVATQRVHLVRNAWDPTAAPLKRAEARQRLHLDDGRFYVGWVGRLSPEKGADLLVEALPELADLPISACMIGSGRERERIAERAKALGVSDRVRWFGSVQDADRLFPAFDVFVLSSRTEGTPIVLFEAMASCVPIIATRVGGVPDVVGPAEAVLIPPETPCALVAAIRTLYERPADGARRARAARVRLAQEFALPPWLDRYQALYTSLARRRVPSHAHAGARAP